MKLLGHARITRSYATFNSLMSKAEYVEFDNSSESRKLILRQKIVLLTYYKTTEMFSTSDTKNHPFKFDVYQYQFILTYNNICNKSASPKCTFYFARMTFYL